MNRRLPPARLLVVLDRPTCDRAGRPLVALGRELIEAGARFLWYRNHPGGAGQMLDDTATLAPLAAPSRGSVVVGDRLDVALLGGAAGVHIPEHGLPARMTHRFEVLNHIGCSCHTPREVFDAETDGATYATLSPIFPATSPKAFTRDPLGLTAIETAAQHSGLPIFALGGITPERVAACLQAGAWGVAVLGGILLTRDPVSELRRYLEAIEASGVGP